MDARAAAPYDDRMQGHRDDSRSKTYRRLGATAAALALCGCLLAPIEKASPAPEATDAARAQSETAPERPGVPRGCTLEWSSVARDSVLNCPDVRPPSPR